jgi:cation diffusion facilitator CzcD-associated flavoprotein CzcO
MFGAPVVGSNAWRWSERYPAQAEILRYLNHVADRFDLRRDFQLETTATATEWDEATGRWTVETDREDRVSARYLILAGGSLSQAKEPDIAGVATFRGLRLHTSACPHTDPDLTGRRVAIIGTGSSAIQAIPLLAQRAEHLLVLQRTPNYALPPVQRRLRVLGGRRGPASGVRGVLRNGRPAHVRRASTR